MSRVEVTGCHGYYRGRCRYFYCHITGCSSCVSSYILASDDHENEDSEREEQRRQRQGGIPGAPRFFLFIIVLFTDYTKTTEVREEARRYPPPRSSHFRHSEEVPTSSCRFRRDEAHFRRSEKVPTSCCFRRDEDFALPIFDAARRYPPPRVVFDVMRTLFFPFSTQRGGTHLLAVSLFLFSPQRGGIRLLVLFST